MNAYARPREQLVVTVLSFCLLVWQQREGTAVSVLGSMVWLFGEYLASFDAVQQQKQQGFGTFGAGQDYPILQIDR